MKPLAVYDGHTRKRLAFLQNAHNISFEKPINALWTGSFSMPYSDPKNKYCEGFNLVELWDVDGANKDKYIGLFRIMPRVEQPLGIDATVEYQLEHVLSTLIDDVMLGWHEIGNLGVYTANVIAYILDRQNDRRWELEVCDYAHQYLYGWQDENLLSALYSVVQPFSETDYYWDFDTLSFPWRLKLVKASPTPVSDIRYRKNIAGITKTVDPTNLTTRLYCYGYGEGDNKLGISNVNNGVPYLESANVGKYGVITQVWTDERFTIEESLKATGEAMLKKLEEPEITYDIDVETIRNAADLTIGDTVRVVVEGLDEYMVVQRISKNDLSGRPQSGKITLGTGTTDISNSAAEIADRQRISESYSQGSESIFAQTYTDNADPENPSEISFTIPENTQHVNEILLSARLQSFRAYSRATEGGGEVTESTTSGGGTTESTSSGGGSRQTSSSGGGDQTTSGYGGNSTQTSSVDGQSTQTSSSGGGRQTTSSTAGGGSVTSASGGGTQYTTSTTGNYGITWYDTTNTTRTSSTSQMNYFTRTQSTTSTGQGSYTSSSSTYPVMPATVNGTSHYHMLRLHSHNFSHDHQVQVAGHNHTIPLQNHSHHWDVSGHTHSVNIPSHTHGIDIPAHTHSVQTPGHTHNVNIPSHSHNVSIQNHTHSIDVPEHTHSVTIPTHSHSVTIPNHIHQIEYGIYEGPTASAMDIYLDDVYVGSTSGYTDDVNLIGYMSKTVNGKVMRGRHVIKIVPNGLTRIECTIQIRLFTNARGGGQY